MKKTILSLLLSIPMLTFANDVIDKFNNTIPTVESSVKETFHSKAIDEIEKKQLANSQYIVVVDRNKDTQILALAYYNKEDNTVEFTNFSSVSTGNNRQGHFITPLGWFENVVEHGSYRAQGTKNSNGIRGYGKKGMRVWDFGWQQAQAGWKNKTDVRDIRLQMHATDPDVLQKKLGTPQSQGCVRVHESVNKFIDNFGILDKHFEEEKYWALSKDRQPVENAGSYILVIDTSVSDQSVDNSQ